MDQTHDGWIFTKTRKFAPGGRIQIGQILAKPFQPESALMPYGPYPLPDGLAVDVTEDTDVNLSTDTELTAMFKLWANINPISVDVAAGAHVDRSNSLSWHFARLSSRQISPPISYVQESLGHGEVPAHLKPPPRWWKRMGRDNNLRVFMVTGITVAEGATLVRKSHRSTRFHASGSSDVSGAGVLSAGGGGKFESTHTDLEKTGASSDFVFAYSVNEVFYRPVSHIPFRLGEPQSVGNGDEQPPDSGAEELLESVVVDDIDPEPYRAGDEVVDRYEGEYNS
ncbi:hypothetical protein GQ53DRAFT_742240 [Thozetella sp. PMI_491]|nr:hypothetical protein GQ53DRAFT_742240 [Thozetella sp. PMI_491]